jgi:uncharacterized protein YxeA
MKKFMISIFAVMALALVFGFTVGDDMPGANVDEFWTYITETSPYTQWAFFEDHKDMQPGKAPHGPFHKVYVNDILINAEGAPVPNGSIVVKESYNEQKQKTAVTVMYKIEGYNTDGGDWWWARYSTDGKGGPAGKLGMCLGCHQAKKANDYIFVHTF